MPSPDCAPLHDALRAQVDQQFLPGVSTALLRGRTVVDRWCYGDADREAQVALRDDHLYRMFSNTKLVTSCAVMQLVEEGLIRLADPVEAYLPELDRLQVLRPGATRIDDTEPTHTSITIEHLMTHTSGLSYGLFDPGSLLFAAYNERRVRNPARPLADMVTALSTLPLSFHPGTAWEYSMATDVLGRLIEVVRGQSFGEVIARRIFAPLGMVDTGFRVPQSERHRLCALYVGADLADPTRPGLSRADDKPYPGAYLEDWPLESGGGGLVSSLDDTIRLVRSLLPDGDTLLRPETIEAMFHNRLPPHLCVRFPKLPRFTHRGFGLGSSVTLAAGPGEPDAIVGEVAWGGLAGTVWWINPRIGIAGVLMTQRWFGFENPFSYVFKREAYRALGF